MKHLASFTLACLLSTPVYAQIGGISEPAPIGNMEQTFRAESEEPAPRNARNNARNTNRAEQEHRRTVSTGIGNVVIIEPGAPANPNRDPQASVFSTEPSAPPPGPGAPNAKRRNYAEELAAMRRMEILDRNGDGTVSQKERLQAAERARSRGLPADTYEADPQP